MLLPHHPGYGESGDLDDLHDIHDLVLHYTELFDQLGLTADVNLVGFSLGGLVAARLAIEQKHRLRRLVLVAPSGLRVPGVEVDDLFRIPPEELIGPAGPPARDAAAAPARRSPRRRLHRRPLPRDAHDGDHAVGAPYDRVRPPLARPGRLPALIVWGEEDRLLPPVSPPRGPVSCREATVSTFPDAGHLVLDESPAAVEAVAGSAS